MYADKIGGEFPLLILTLGILNHCKLLGMRTYPRHLIRVEVIHIKETELVYFPSSIINTSRAYDALLTSLKKMYTDFGFKITKRKTRSENPNFGNFRTQQASKQHRGFVETRSSRAERTHAHMRAMCCCWLRLSPLALAAIALPPRRWKLNTAWWMCALESAQVCVCVCVWVDAIIHTRAHISISFSAALHLEPSLLVQPLRCCMLSLYTHAHTHIYTRWSTAITTPHCSLSVSASRLRFVSFCWLK